MLAVLFFFFKDGHALVVVVIVGAQVLAKFSIDARGLAIAFVQFNDAILFFYKLFLGFSTGCFALGFVCAMKLLVEIFEHRFDIAGGAFDVFVELTAFFHSGHSTVGQSKER